MFCSTFFSIFLLIVSASQHSGGADQDFGNDLDNSKNGLNNSLDADQESDSEERIEFQCSVCERKCSDLEQ